MLTDFQHFFSLAKSVVNLKKISRPSHHKPVVKCGQLHNTKSYLDVTRLF